LDDHLVNGRRPGKWNFSARVDVDVKSSMPDLGAPALVCERKNHG
jgi:hypothetical protein